MKFNDLDISTELKEAIKRQKFEEPTEVQEKSLPILLEGKDLIIRSKTGSGKTLGFLLPILQKLEVGKGVQAVIIAPTRELALQINKEVRKLTKGFESVTVYGGVAINPQIEKLRTAEIVIGTPGRMLDHLERRTFDASKVRFAVLDEADRMFEMGMIEDIDRILQATPKNRQTSLWSATMPEEIRRLAQKYMKSPGELMLQQDEITVNDISQTFYGMERKKKMSMLTKVLRSKECNKAIIFCNTKRWTDTLNKILWRKGFKCKALHSDLTQAKRNFVINDFKNGKFSILVATDVAARGLHVDSVSHVINYDIPRNPKDYVHRIGRTGRAGASGSAISFLTNTDSDLLRSLERELQHSIKVENVGEGFSPSAHPAQPIQPVAETGSIWDRMD